MKVFKFGGTSVGLPERMIKVAGILTRDEEPKMVVLSAVAGTTNDLIAAVGASIAGNIDEALYIVEKLERKYNSFIIDLYHSESSLERIKDFLLNQFGSLKSLIKESEIQQKEILSKGEIISTKIFVEYLEEQGKSVVLLDALGFMKINENEDPDIDFLKKNLTPHLKAGIQLFVTQGFICINNKGGIDNLKRGGSDYTASLIGAAINSEEVQIWTDIDGLHNNDPRVVKETHAISELSFDEAAELAYFGAKILHPSSILPAQKFNIPVRLKSTMNESAPGTLISKESIEGTVKAIAVKDGITAIKIKSSRMLLAYGFLSNIFEVFENHKTSIDMITTSEVAVSLTIDDRTHLSEILPELRKFGLVEVDENLSIICVVGNMVSEKKGVIRKIFNALSDIPIRMVSYGGSRYNISMLIETNYKHEALNNLNSGLFE